jgi:hypothetical protein
MEKNQTVPFVLLVVLLPILIIVMFVKNAQTIAIIVIMKMIVQTVQMDLVYL